MGWFKSIDNENFEFWECDKCPNPKHNYIVVKEGILRDTRKKSNIIKGFIFSMNFVMTLFVIGIILLTVILDIID